MIRGVDDVELKLAWRRFFPMGVCHNFSFELPYEFDYHRVFIHVFACYLGIVCRSSLVEHHNISISDMGSNCNSEKMAC